MVLRAGSRPACTPRGPWSHGTIKAIHQHVVAMLMYHLYTHSVAHTAVAACVATGTEHKKRTYILGTYRAVQHVQAASTRVHEACELLPRSFTPDGVCGVGAPVLGLQRRSLKQQAVLLNLVSDHPKPAANPVVLILCDTYLTTHAGTSFAARMPLNPFLYNYMMHGS
jgi:hypothetical protein